MEKEQSLGQKFQQSEEEFRKQFNPNSVSFHGGSSEPVPLGGQRVPQSMPTTYPENFDPSQQVQIDYGPQYKQIQTDRLTLQNLKKSLAKLCPVLQAFLRHEENFKQKGDPNNQKHIQVHEQHMAKESENLKAVQQELIEYIPLLQQMAIDGKLNAKDLKSVVEESNKKYSTKQSLTDFNFKVKKLSSKTFSDAGKYLQKMKDIKKEYAKKQKQQQVGKKQTQAETANKGNQSQ